MFVQSTDRLLRLSEVQTLTTLSRSSIYRKVREGDFPVQLKVGARAVHWRQSEIEGWLATRPRATGDESLP